MVPARKAHGGKLGQEKTSQAGGGREQSCKAGQNDCGHFYERGEFDVTDGSTTSLFQD